MFVVFSSGVGLPSLACGVKGSPARLSLGFLHVVLVLQHLLLVSVTQRLDWCVPDVVKKTLDFGGWWMKCYPKLMSTPHDLSPISLC